ncbi:peroxisomal d3,d2-enoyl-CoA isomerase [Eremomyces bilateralis CBS 781.70]|uniref:Peroxisomal d3,d2-enoyl-CoA isomerase n=1 Tax=Eremomyces bilateralis CBS 781.70 TaxID=1392243 RepID=A0A6G1GD27_9PEZI|nr:peroxisomal d3,d2-enoyl-CoA isomerase [Eremomyces bilateralis CBS 781.70]KAF1815810.1 peroxisomal d3,d2-enoyl-CoA isomerase [Eremomyces bilateralis CBS 781.70]
MTFKNKYTDIIVEIKGQIGIIKFNRPKALNSFGGNLIQDTVGAIRELNEHPDTVFTVLTGEGRFFSSGADVKAHGTGTPQQFNSLHEKKLSFLQGFLPTYELLRSIIDHKKVFVLAMNGPGVGGGAAWVQGFADIVLAAEGAYMQVPFSALGLVPENGSAIGFSQHIGVHRANDFLMFGRQVTVQEMEQWGMVNRIFPKEGFHAHVVKFLEDQLDVNDGKSMIEMKRLQNAPLRDGRIVAVTNAMDALSERFVEDAPAARFAAKKKLLESKRGSKI